MDDKQEKKNILRDMVRREALRGTSPRRTLEMMRAMIAQNPSLLDAEDLEQLLRSEGRPS